MFSIVDMIPNKFIFRSEPKFMLNLSFRFAIGMQSMLRGSIEMRWRRILIENDTVNVIKLKLFSRSLNEDLEMKLKVDFIEVRLKN
jgi:hypothetical protein